MQDRFVGDVKDFGKYKLLRTLCGTPRKKVAGMELGVVWCYNKTRPAPGKEWKFAPISDVHKRIDESLYDSLSRCAGENQTVDCVQRSEILPTDIFYPEPLFKMDQSNHLNLLKNDRKDRWLEHAINTIAPMKVVFIDPDTGIAPPGATCEDEKKKASSSAREAEYIFIDELRQFWDAGKSLIVFQDKHHNKIDEQVSSIACRLSTGGLTAEIGVLLWQCLGRTVLFVAIPHPNHKELRPTPAPRLL